MLHTQEITWNVFEAVLHTKPTKGEQGDLKISFTEFFITKLKIFDPRIDFDAKNKTVLRFAVPSSSLQHNHELKSITDFLKIKTQVKEVTWPGQMIKDPDVTKSIE